MVQDRGSGRCGMVKGFGGMRGYEGAKTERSETMRRDKLKSEFWGKTSFFFRVDTKVLDTNDK